MRYIITFIVMFCLSLTINAQSSSDKTQRSNLAIENQTASMAAPAIQKSLERFKEAVTISDIQSQKELKAEIFAMMDKVIDGNLKAAKLNKSNRLQAAERKENITLQKQIIKQARTTESSTVFQSSVELFLKSI